MFTVIIAALFISHEVYRHYVLHICLLRHLTLLSIVICFTEHGINCNLFYRIVINDLSRVLLLLTKKSSIMMPADGNKLLLWADRVLQRFKQQKTENKVMFENWQQHSKNSSALVSAFCPHIYKLKFCQRRLGIQFLF